MRQDDPRGNVDLRIPLGTGIAGAVAQSGWATRVADAPSDPRFNPEIDRKTGFVTRSILCLPLRNRDGEVSAVAQLLNPLCPFTERDVARCRDFVGPPRGDLGHLAPAVQSDEVRRLGVTAAAVGYPGRREFSCDHQVRMASMHES